MAKKSASSKVREMLKASKVQGRDPKATANKIAAQYLKVGKPLKLRKF